MLEALADRPLPLRKSAWRDLLDGARHIELWPRLGWQEVKHRYQRTALGPFWSVISLAVFVVTIGAVGAGLWKQDLDTYLPYLTAGMVAWTMISTTLTEACAVFITSAGLLRSAQCDFSLLAYALVWRNLLVLLHHLSVCLLLMLVLAPHLLTPATLLLIPSLILLAVNGVWLTLLLGMACLRFRDIQQLVASIMQIAMFVTPIFWPIDQLARGRLLVVHLNPLYHCVEIARAPMLGTVPTQANYIVVIALAIVGWLVTLCVFGRYRDRIPYWS